MNWFKLGAKKGQGVQHSQNVNISSGQQTFILEPILTPSGLIDTDGNTPDSILLDLETNPLPEIDFTESEVDADVETDADSEASNSADTHLDIDCSLDINIPDEELEPLDFIEHLESADPHATTAASEPTLDLTQPDFPDADVEGESQVLKATTTAIPDTDTELLQLIDGDEASTSEPIDGLPTDEIYESSDELVADSSINDLVALQSTESSLEPTETENLSSETIADSPISQTEHPEELPAATELPQETVETGSQLDALTSLTVSHFDSGVFTVSESGEVGIDFLFDGGAYKGELAIFSLDGMMELEAGSNAFIQEAARRALSDSIWGHIVISDATEGARFSGSFPGEGNYNAGEYLGIKTVTMRPGDTFAVMLVPNGTVQQVLDNPLIGGAIRPLFSLGTANPHDAFHLRQIADVTGDGNTFVMEDLRVDGTTDLDYNDIIFQIRGATGKAGGLEGLIAVNKDWRHTELGQALITYAKPYITSESVESAEEVTYLESATDVSPVSLIEQPILESDVVEAVPTENGIATANEGMTSELAQAFPETTRQEAAEITSELAVSQEEVISTTTDANSLSATETLVEGGEAIAHPYPSANIVKLSHDEVAFVTPKPLPAAVEQPVSQEEAVTDAIASSTSVTTEQSTAFPTTEAVASTLSSPSTPITPLPQTLVVDETDSTNSGEPTHSSVAVTKTSTVTSTPVQNTIISEVPLANPSVKETPASFPSTSIPIQDQFLTTSQPLIGIIDTGFSGNNSDINYSRIILGQDWIDGDANPLLPTSEGDDAGTHALGIISATQNNGIGINGINNSAPIWISRASDSQWAEALVEFVDAAQQSEQPNAVITINFDLTQNNLDGSISPRYKLTSNERAAIEYARQNGVLIVAAAGDNGGIMSALGQASQEFDNIITVGAAEQINSKIAPAKGFVQADYSNYGYGLDIVADGGTVEKPVLSTVGDGVNADFGTEVAAAKVTGAISQVWAANPKLNYRQIVEIIKSTATDLNVANWDEQTGAGLLNLAAAVNLAKATAAQIYEIPPINPKRSEVNVTRPYTVRPGDTLWTVAQRELNNGRRWTEIKKENGDTFTANEPLPVGKIIYLPVIYTNPTSPIPPQDLLFITDRFYNPNETVSVLGKVYNDDADELGSVEFWLQKDGGEWQHIGKHSEFTIDTSDNSAGFTYTLPKLAPGHYQLKAAIGGTDVSAATKNFTVLSVPPGEELSNRVKWAITRAVNLESYDTKDLAATRQWVVSVQAGQSSPQLATLLGAKDLGATTAIPNTYIWEFPPGIDANKIAAQLSQQFAVEFAYPLVQIPVNWLSPINEPLVKDGSQWHLRSDVKPNSDANITNVWQNQSVLGSGVVIGTVDDGFEIADPDKNLEAHPDLLPNYRPDLSYDFDEQDNIPSRSLNTTVQHPELPQKIADQSKNKFYLNSVVSGWINNLQVNLDIEHDSANGLDIYLIAPPQYEQQPLGERRIQLLSNVGDGEHTINSNKFLGYRAAEIWELEIVDKKTGDNKSGWLKNWSIDFETYNFHGTAVTGVAAASGSNNIGGSGVAPNANWAGLRMGADGTTDIELPNVLAHKNQDIDIYNNSWGIGLFDVLPSSQKVIEKSANQGRNGLGNIYIFAGGNSQKDSNENPHGNVNYNSFANSRHTIAVAAIDHEGKQTEYSEPGAPLLVSAYSDNGSADKVPTVGITTTKGYSNDGNDENDYTDMFGGTSASAPFVSGVIALMLEANPNLTQRDVQHILIETAHKNDPNDSDWKQNGAGYWVNHKYGFGAINAEAAVELARTWDNVTPEVQVSQQKLVGQKIPDYNPNSPQSLTSTITVNQQDDTLVEWVEVEFKGVHRYLGDLEIVLEHTYTDADGKTITTESRLAEKHFHVKYTGNKNFYPWVFTSARHWGEPAQGEWKLRVADKSERLTGFWESWKLDLYGTSDKPTVTIIANDANASEDGDTGEFIIARSGSTDRPLTVYYTVSDGATNGTDYNLLNGSITIPVGSSTASIPIVPIDDDIPEGIETVGIYLIDDDAYRVEHLLYFTVGLPPNAVAIADNDSPQLPDRWNARFINRTADNASDRNSYDFSNPVAILDLGDQNQGRTDGGLRLYRDFDANPVSNVQDDYFAMDAWTRTNFEAGKLYKITTRSDDGTWFRLRNPQTGQWVGDSVVLAGDGADWRDRGTAQPPRTIFFRVPESGEYDFYLQYYERTEGAVLDINIEEAQFFQDPVNESQQWKSTVFWWDRQQGNVPPSDFYNNPDNIIGVVSQGSNTRSDGKQGINFSFPELTALNNDVRLPDNNYAIRSYTQTNLEAGVKYRARVRGDDGFQLLAKLANTDQWVYITPKDQWQQAYGAHQQIDFTVPRDGMYDMHFHHYEERGNAYLDFSWEVVPFRGTVLATAGANIRSAPNTSQPPVGFLNYGTPVTFDKWTRGQFIDYRNELGTASDIWYRIAGTNRWISAAIIDGAP